MATLKDLKKYLTYTFSTGCYTGDDYKSFERKYKNYLKSVCNDNGWELVKFSPNHYEFTCFIKKEDKYIYFSISDVRYFKNQWYSNILVRTAKDDRDYTGGSNQHTSLEELPSYLGRMFAR